ncbi:MAG TPA: DUF2955 domain-containing protein [Woeseiaceae bacterium]|nr:DUF2955 domain-containing protein [Woeseiaceae bacterium]
MQIAHVRILRLALGTALSMWVSQAVAWDLSFIAPVMTLFILALPLPALSLKTGIKFLAAMTLSMYASLLLLPWLLDYPLVGLLLLLLALYWSFYFTAKGGSPVLGTFVTVGIALSTAVGSVNVDATLMLVRGLIMNATIGVVFVWIAHALLPDSKAGGFPAPAGAQAAGAPDPEEARWSALRSTVIVFPVAFWFMLSGASTSYIPVMIKVASMGQQATNEGARFAGRSLILSTIIGGIGAIIGWNVLSVAPELSLYALLIALAGLVFGPKIFRGKGLHPDAATWSYAYLTMIVILAPAVMDSASGSSANVAFWSRLLMFALATLYGVAAVFVVDAFRLSAKDSGSEPLPGKR